MAPIPQAPAKNLRFLDFPLRCRFATADKNECLNRCEAEKGVGGTGPSGGDWGLESRAHCVGFSVMKIGNRKERLRVREAGASAAGRGQRPYASFPDKSLRQVWAAAQS